MYMAEHLGTSAGSLAIAEELSWLHSLSGLFPTGDPSRHDEDVLIPQLFRARRAGVARVSARACAVEDERRVSVCGKLDRGELCRIEMLRPRHVARRPLVLVTRVDDRHRLGAQDPLRHVLDVDRFECR